MNYKALLIPFNSKQEIFLQDRTGHRPPPWGFFGGSIEEGETAIEALIRETKEELSIDILESEVDFIGEFLLSHNDIRTHATFFLYRTEQQEFTVLEGAGGEWLSFAKAAERLDKGETFEKIKEAILK